MSFLVCTAHQTGCWKSLLCFLECGIITPVCNFSFVHRLWLLFLRTLWLLDMLSLPHSGHTWESGYRVTSVCLELRELGMPMDLLVRFSGRELPNTHGQISCWNHEAVSKNCVPLVPFEILTCFFPLLLLSCSHGGPASVLGVLLERNGFL